MGSIFLSSQHLLALSCIACLGFAIVKLPKSHEARIKNALVIGLIAIFPLNLLATFLTWGTLPLANLIPAQLCDIVILTSLFSLLSKKQIARELTYFWVLAGTAHGLITPNLSADAGTLRFLSFFFHHGLVVLIALYLPIRLQWRPRPNAWWRAWLWLQVYALVAMLINLALGTNFGFLNAPPEHPSLINKLGTFPWYLLSMEITALIVLFLLSLPFRRENNINS